MQSSSLQQYFATLSATHRPPQRNSHVGNMTERQYPISVSSIILVSDPAGSPPARMRKRLVASKKLPDVTPMCLGDKKQNFDRWNSGDVSGRGSADSSPTSFSSPKTVTADGTTTSASRSDSVVSSKTNMARFRAASLPIHSTSQKQRNATADLGSSHLAGNGTSLKEDRRWSDGIQQQEPAMLNDSNRRACSSADDTSINYRSSSDPKPQQSVVTAHPPSPTPQLEEQRRRQLLRRYKSMDSSSHKAFDMKLTHSLPIVTRVESFGDLSTTSSTDTPPKTIVGGSTDAPNTMMFYPTKAGFQQSSNVLNNRFKIDQILIPPRVDPKHPISPVSAPSPISLERHNIPDSLRRLPSY